MDDIPLYPGLPEQAQIGEVPDDDGEIMEAAYGEAAAGQYRLILKNTLRQSKNYVQGIFINKGLSDC